MKNSLIILLFFICGVLLGICGLIPEKLIDGNWSQITLYVLMFLIGITIGSDKKSIDLLRRINFRIFLIPIGVVVGTLIGSVLASFLLKGISPGEAAAVGAGYGYYSLSSIFITEMHSEQLGVVALLSNILREITTLLATPLFVKYFGKLAGIFSGGATSMDTTLPVIVRYSGKEFAMISVFSGIVLTVLVPFVVSFFLSI